MKNEMDTPTTQQFYFNIIHQDTQSMSFFIRCFFFSP